MTDSGVVLEARVQRLFLAQGIFAERSLWPAADSHYRLMATDIDVLVSEYGSGYHLTRRHAECKSGKKVRTLDRVLWLKGVRSLLAADASYLVVPSFNLGGVDFARSLDIDVLTIKELSTWEKALNIRDDDWPCRSDFKVLDPIREQTRRLGKRGDSTKADRAIRFASRFVEVDSWRVFGYGRLNRLLRILKDLSEVYNELHPKDPKRLAVRYCTSALLVRFSQYLLAICRDVSRVPVTDLNSYVLDRLTYGDQDPKHARGLVQSTVDWMSEGLKQRSLPVPPEADATRLFRVPWYSAGLVALVEKLLKAPNAAAYLAIAMEVEQFGKESDPELFPNLNVSWLVGRDLAQLVRGFAVASLGIDRSVICPVGTQVDREQGTSLEDNGTDQASAANQKDLFS